MNPSKISTADQLVYQAKYFPQQTAFIYEGKTWSYQEFLDEVKEFASALEQQGVKKGDRVAYLGLNSVTFMKTMVAAWWIGAVFAPFNFRLVPLEVADLIERSRPKAFVVEPTLLDVIEHIPDIAWRAETLDLLLVDNDEAVPAPPEFPGYMKTLTDYLAAVDIDSLGAPYSALEETLAVLMFTSGTTGHPKGVQLTHGNLWWNSLNVDSLVDTRRGDVNIAVAPLFHIGALNALTIRVLARGGTNLIRRTFDPRKVLADIEEYQVAQGFLVPAMLAAMEQTEEFDRYDISSLRALICAGAPVPPSLLEKYKRKSVPVQQAWGLTETAPFATYLPTELTYEKPGSCGIPMPYTEVKIVSADLQDVQTPGEVGEMWVKGPNVTGGYWENPDATANSFTDGWFQTGDLGYQDEDGYFFIVDRLKDMIISGGENVYPAEVERVLSGYPGVLDVAVVGVEDEKWGEIVVAVCTCAPGQQPTIDEVRAFAEPYLARYKLPKKIIITDTMHRNGSGKLIKGKIRDDATKAVHGS